MRAHEFDASYATKDGVQPRRCCKCGLPKLHRVHHTRRWHADQASKRTVKA